MFGIEFIGNTRNAYIILTGQTTELTIWESRKIWGNIKLYFGEIGRDFYDGRQIRFTCDLTKGQSLILMVSKLFCSGSRMLGSSLQR